jgi:hypothetical protein
MTSTASNRMIGFAVTTAIAGVMLTLYIMRRRTRLGKRAPKF